MLVHPCHSLPLPLRFAMWPIRWPTYMDVLAVAGFACPAAFGTVVWEAGQCWCVHAIPCLFHKDGVIDFFCMRPVA